MAEFTNRLINESSPYLLQHAHNPVDWYPWSEEALAKAKSENKPILVSIGYSACHWCHVMEKESFEDKDTADLMNSLFVNIKIDREERPDLDHIYMDAVQAMTGSGGWPLNVFLTPETKPFYGGTYFPPSPAFNRSSWKDVLLGVSQAFNERRHEVDAQAENLTEHLQSSNQFGTGGNGTAGFTTEEMDTVFKAIMQNADKKEGGFGRAPKFPQTFCTQFLLHYYAHTKNESSLQQALLSLDKMIYGGIYDQLGGGFARYSTDNEWLVPHFEKMLYDNALLLNVMSEAYQLTKNKLYKQTIDDTISFLLRELYSEEGGFYAALDADSEGVEGKFYVWSKEEIDKVLGEDAAVYSEFYDITEKGNWEHANILNIKKSVAVFVAEKNISIEAFEELVRRSNKKLLAERSKRIRPGLDDKILLSWNALMITALCKSYSATGNESYLQQAVGSLDFLWTKLREGGELRHSYKNGRATQPAFLDDYAYLVQALIHMQEVTGDQTYLTRARELVIEVIKLFGEEETGLFFYTSTNQNDVIVRKKEVYDGATPSGNSIMAFNLQYVGIVFDRQDWRDRAARITGSLKQVIVKYPGSFAVWAMVAQSLARGVPEIALIGENLKKAQLEFLRTFIPLRIFQSGTHSNNDFPLLSGKPYSPEAQFYLCQNYSCQTPVYEIDALLRQMKYV